MMQWIHCSQVPWFQPSCISHSQHGPLQAHLHCPQLYCPLYTILKDRPLSERHIPLHSHSAWCLNFPSYKPQTALHTWPPATRISPIHCWWWPATPSWRPYQETLQKPLFSRPQCTQLCGSQLQARWCLLGCCCRRSWLWTSTAWPLV